MAEAVSRRAQKTRRSGSTPAPCARLPHRAGTIPSHVIGWEVAGTLRDLRDVTRAYFVTPQIESWGALDRFSAPLEDSGRGVTVLLKSIRPTFRFSCKP